MDNTAADKTAAGGAAAGGSGGTERVQLIEHLQFGITALHALGAQQATVELACWDGPSARVADAVRGALAELPGAGLADAPHRPGGRAYYTGCASRSSRTSAGRRSRSRTAGSSTGPSGSWATAKNC